MKMPGARWRAAGQSESLSQLGDRGAALGVLAPLDVIAPCDRQQAA
jgi:hypothetical protein